VDEDAKREIRGALQAWGYQPTFFSVATGEGLGEVAALLKDKVAVIAGPSGVGKSSLINRLHLAADQDMYVCVVYRNPIRLCPSAMHVPS